MITISDVRQAMERIRPFIHRTPILTSTALNEMFGAELFFKCENFQKVGAFKARGACNAVLLLKPEQASRGVVTHSSGNHAQALAYAARLQGLKCTIVMPSNAPTVKKQAVIGYGATIIECEPTLEARLATMNRFIEDTGAHAVPPYNDERVMAGQGTAALELLEDVANINVVMAPVGGGGLMSGTAVATQALAPEAEIVGAEPVMASDAYESLRTGVLQPPPTTFTIADGLRTSLGDLPFEVLKSTRVKISLASETSIMDALYLMMERLKIVVEPSAAVTIATMMENPELARGKRVGIIVCGGNLDVRSFVGA